MQEKQAGGKIPAFLLLFLGGKSRVHYCLKASGGLILRFALSSDLPLQNMKNSLCNGSKKNIRLNY